MPGDGPHVSLQQWGRLLARAYPLSGEIGKHGLPI
jgi:hypothetical protein